MSQLSRYVLFVDDEQNILNALERELHEWLRQRGLKAAPMISARKGLEFLAEKGAETVLVVSDLRMPEMKGSDFLLEVRARFPDLVTMLLTGYSETEEIVKAVRAGIFSFMLKPWDSEYLVAEMQKAYEYGELRRQNAKYTRMIEEELKWAGEMQKAMLRPTLPRSEGVEFRSSYRPVPGLYCGGDYYDAIMIGPGRYLLMIGDVAGHGVKAAFVTGILKAVIFPEYVRARNGKDLHPGDFLSWLNDRMNFELRSASGLIITFLAGVLDLKAGTFLYANAGQTHPFLLRGKMAVELPVSGSGIGFAGSVAYAEQIVDVKPGDAITLYTDGLVEAGCSEGCAPVRAPEVFGSIEYSPEYHKRLMEAALAVSGQSRFDDDVTILTARIL